MIWFQNELLHTPIQNLGNVQFVFRRTSNLMNPTKLSQLFPGFAQHTQHFAIQTQFVNAARKSVRAVQHLMGRRRNANSPWRSGLSRRGRVRHLVADSRARVSVDRDINNDLAEEFAVPVENLDAAITSISNINVALAVHRDAVGCVELPWLIARFSPGL